MNLYWTSDNHFGHENIIQHCNRPFKNADEMDQYMIDQWNSVVTNDDEVFHLGDLGHKRTSRERMNEILRSLNGSINLICGNHEIDAEESKTNQIRDFDWYLRQLRFDPSLLSSMNPGYHEIRIDGRLVVMSHYGMETWHGSNKDKSFHLHGHSHGKLAKKTRRLDVGVDTHEFRPWSWEEIRDHFDPKRKRKEAF